MRAILDSIADIEVAIVSIPLDQPLYLGAMTITTRTYAVTTVTTSAGLTGHAFALTRDTPVDRVAATLRPILIGQDADAIAARYDDCMRFGIPGGRTGAFARTVALVDIALWDIKAQRAGLPLWRLLGGGATQVPVLLVAGYPREAESAEELAARVVNHAHSGYLLLKIARALDGARMQQLLQALGDTLPDGARIVVDCGWHFRTPLEVVDEVRRWPDVPIAWIEDPLPGDDVRANARLRAMLHVPLGSGDDLTDAVASRELLLQEAVDVLRVDVGTLGITGALRTCILARTLGVPVSLHIYPETSIHLAAAFSPPLLIETFDPIDNPFDPTHRFVDSRVAFASGWAEAPTNVGLGFEIDSTELESVG